MSSDLESPNANEISAVHHNATDSILIQNAMAAAAEEKAMGFRAVMRIHWKAAMWSCIFSLALVMEGYDLGIVSPFETVADGEDQLLLRSGFFPETLW
jgi:SP family general alpha glucoside:H+ symporter-like MFS transporter